MAVPPPLVLKWHHDAEKPRDPWRPWSRRKKALFSAVNILGLSVSAANFNSIGDVDCYFWESLWFIFYFLLLFSLIFLWHLFPGQKFLFFQFLLGYLFLLCSLLFWFREELLFFSKDHFSVAVWSDHELCKSWTTSWGFCSPGSAQCSENLYIKPLSSVLLFAYVE